MNSIRKIFLKKIDEDVHKEFIKFGKGTFELKYLLGGKKQKDKWAVKSGPEFANYLVGKGLEGLDGKIQIKGIIVSTLKLDIDYVQNIKQFMGVKQYVIDGEIEAKRIIELLTKYSKAFFALSFSMPGFDLKIKPKMPKSPKPSATGEKEPKANFCSLKTSKKEIVDDLFFDIPDFNSIKISHTIRINEIIMPQGVSEPNEIREKAIRKGIITRIANVDGKEERKESEFEI